MADVTVRGAYTSTLPSRAPTFQTAEDCLYPMPTREEVVAAGYPPTKWDSVKAEYDEFIRRWNAEPEFRVEAIARAKENHKLRVEHEAKIKREHEEYMREMRGGR